MRAFTPYNGLESKEPHTNKACRRSTHEMPRRRGHKRLETVGDRLKAMVCRKLMPPEAT